MGIPTPLSVNSKSTLLGWLDILKTTLDQMPE